MRFNSQELGVKLAGPKCAGQSHREDCADSMDIPGCIDCTTPSVKGGFEKSHPDKDCKESSPGPGKGKGKGKGKKKGGSYAAGLELLREQLRESLDSAAR
jgi:hypothetical protein